MASNDINLDTPRTGVPSEQYKANWDLIFGKKPEVKRCGACGIDRTNGAMCEDCSNAMAGKSLNRKRQIQPPPHPQNRRNRQTSSTR